MGHTRAVIHGVTVRVGPLLVESVVVTEGKMVIVVDVPVYAGEELGIGLVARIIGIRTSIITILLFHEIGHFLHIRHSGAGDILVRIRHAVGGRPPAVDYTRIGITFGVDEEEEFVLDDGTSQCNTIGHVFIGERIAKILTVNHVSVEIFIFIETVDGSLEGVGTRLGDSVDTAAHEISLPYIEGGNHNLDFLDGVDGNRGAAAGEVGRKAEVVVEVGTVNREVGGTTIGTCEAHSVTCIRRDPCNVRNAPADGGHLNNLGVGNVGRSAGLFLSSKLGGGGSHNHNCLKELCGLLQPDVQVIGLTKLEGNVRVVDALVTQVGEFYGVGTTGTHTLDGITTVSVGHSTVNGT